jgi:hypothetical protein
LPLSFDTPCIALARTASNNSSIVAFTSVAAQTCVRSHCLLTAGSSGSFSQYYVHIHLCEIRKLVYHGINHGFCSVTGIKRCVSTVWTSNYWSWRAQKNSTVVLQLQNLTLQKCCDMWENERTIEVGEFNTESVSGVHTEMYNLNEVESLPNNTDGNVFFS